MALPTWVDLKIYIKAQTNAEDGSPTDGPVGTGNGLLAMIMAESQAMVERYIGRYLAATDKTYVDRLGAKRAYFIPTRLQVPMTPVDPDSVSITDKNGLVVDPTTYTVDGLLGQVIANEDISFGAPPYTIACTVGLATHPDYPNIEPIVRAAILDIAANLYQSRNPASVTEAAGGGVSVTYGKDGIAPRTLELLRSIRQIGWV